MTLCKSFYYLQPELREHCLIATVNQQNINKSFFSSSASFCDKAQRDLLFKYKLGISQQMLRFIYVFIALHCSVDH